MLEDLAYRRLIDLYYLSERPLSGCTADIAREIGMLAEVASVEYVLGKFFTLVDGLYLNKRCEDEIAKYRDKQAKASAAGKLSAQRRIVRSTDVEQAVSGRATNQEPVTKNQEPKIDTQKVSPPDGVSIQVWADFIKHRRVLKAPITDTAIAGLRREATKAGMSLEQALITSIENNWRGFKAEWIKTPQTSTLMKGVL